jgi:hypothetical protein
MIPVRLTVYWLLRSRIGVAQAELRLFAPGETIDPVRPDFIDTILAPAVDRSGDGFLRSGQRKNSTFASRNHRKFAGAAEIGPLIANTAISKR